MKRRMPVVCLAFSGGLDTTYCAILLREEGRRVHAGFRVLQPELEVLAPVRDCGVSCEAETEYCASFGVRIPGKTTLYSVNEGLWGTTIGGGRTHDPWELPSETLYPGNTLAQAP